MPSLSPFHTNVQSGCGVGAVIVSLFHLIKPFSDHLTSNIVNKHVCTNSRRLDLVIPNSKTPKYISIMGARVVQWLTHLLLTAVT